MDWEACHYALISGTEATSFAKSKINIAFLPYTDKKNVAQNMNTQLVYPSSAKPYGLKEVRKRKSILLSFFLVNTRTLDGTILPSSLGSLYRCK